MTPHILHEAWVILGVEAIGSVLVVGGVLAALGVLIAGRGIQPARVRIADGAIAGLGFKAAATLLKTLELGSWRQIGSFACILALRILLKRVFQAEVRRDRARTA